MPHMDPIPAAPAKEEHLLDLKRLCTQELLLLLEQSPQVEPVLSEYGGSLDAPAFSSYLNMLMEDRAVSTAQLCARSLLSRSFTYQLCSGIRAPSRDIVLRLALVLRLSMEETQRLLRSAQRGALYPKVRRDAIMIFALTHRLHLFDADELLCSLGETPLLS